MAAIALFLFKRNGGLQPCKPSKFSDRQQQKTKHPSDTITLSKLQSMIFTSKSKHYT